MRAGFVCGLMGLLGGAGCDGGEGLAAPGGCVATVETAYTSEGNVARAIGTVQCERPVAIEQLTCVEAKQGDGYGFLDCTGSMVEGTQLSLEAFYGYCPEGTVLRGSVVAWIDGGELPVVASPDFICE